MFYLDANEEAIRSRFNTFSLYILVFFYLGSYYFLDRTYTDVWFGFPIALFSYLILRCLIHRKRSASAPHFYNNRSKFFKLLIWAFITNFCFFALQYIGHYPVLSQEFTPVITTLLESTEYSGPSTGIDDTYWSFKFSLPTQDLYTKEVLLPSRDDKDEVQSPSDRHLLDNLSGGVGCGCGNEYGDWGDIIFNPSMPNRYYDNKFGVPGIKIPTWLCLCYSRDRCTSKYIAPDDNVQTYQLFYRIVGDPELALKNTQCPPPDRNFVQIYREQYGAPAHDSLFLNFTLGFSSSAASLSLLISFILIYFTENYGNRITFVVLSSIVTVLLEISVIVFEKFEKQPAQKLLPFLLTMLGSGYIFLIFQKGDVLKIFITLKKKFKKIFLADLRTVHPAIKFLNAVLNALWFFIGCFWAMLSLIIVMWGKGRFKIFAMKEFKITEEKYSMVYKNKELIKRNKLLNSLTLLDAVIFRCGEAAFLLSMLMVQKVSHTLLVDVCLGFVSYEALSCIYPLVRQTYALKSFNYMLESLHPRYFNVTVVRRERLLKREESASQKRGELEESIELRNRREPEIILNQR